VENIHPLPFANDKLIVAFAAIQKSKRPLSGFVGSLQAIPIVRVDLNQ
jgi:hypothetical protein